MTESKVPNLVWYVLIIVLILTVQIFTQIYQGHVYMCECGFIKFWHGAINSPEDSQHLSDWYTFSHIIHGFVFYWLLKKFTKNKFSLGTYLVLAIAIESGWEILENSPLIINRYRETASLMYFGDSIINSMFDVIYMVLGFILAWKIPIWLSVILVILMEIFVLYFIRDNLALNIIMLLYPFEAIKNWQLGI
ncbi:MAG: DUF2585 family protein [Minisyncoccia bacterium]